MSTIETMIQEYGQLIKERDIAKMELKAYQDTYNALAQSLGIEPSRLLKMKVVSCETQKQAWSGKEIVFVAFEEEHSNML